MMTTRPTPVELVHADATAAYGERIDLERASCPRGFRAGAVVAGLRKSGKPDMALFLADVAGGASAAGVFTRSLVRAAPIEISEENLRASGGRCAALLINSGCANAATGREGRERAERTARALASGVGCAPEAVQVASTGVIGVQLQDEKMVAAYPRLLESAAHGGMMDAAQAILTTDTCVKAVDLRVEHGGRTLHVAGVAKGSGMIHPDMATMIGVVLTDAQATAEELAGSLRRATDRTFNRISVDGDTSTNDCVYALASGAAGAFPAEALDGAIERVCRELALKIVRDGEGAKKVVRVRVSGARTSADALALARTVAGSLLVRTAIAGGDPNWGRILAASGRAGVAFDLAKYRLSAGGVALFERGAPANSEQAARKAAFAGPEVNLDIDLGAGDAAEEVYTCDLTEGYIKINAEYTT